MSHLEPTGPIHARAIGRAVVGPLALAFSLVLSLPGAGALADPVAKNGILFIGDGMGPAQVTAARIYSANARDGRLVLDSFPHTAIVRTWASDHMVADSAAAGTSLATGVKTYNGAIGVAPPAEPGGEPIAIETILEKAKKAGKSVGVVSTTTVTHATPACFFAHVKSRGDVGEIAAQLVDEDTVDLAFGGGRLLFFAPGAPELSGKKPEDPRGAPPPRKDGRVLADDARAKGIRVLASLADFRAFSDEVDAARAKGAEAPKLPRAIGLFADDQMTYDLDRATEGPHAEPSLEEMTDLAIRILSTDPDGFFLMVEGGRVDHACHTNEAKRALGDMLAFDRAIGRGLEMTREANDTLAIVTADHETGGLAINAYSPIETGGDALFRRSAGMAPGPVDALTFASGPGADREKIAGVDKLDTAYKQPALLFQPMGLHTGVDVHGYAAGPGAEAMRGTIENTEVPRIMMRAMGLPE